MTDDRFCVPKRVIPKGFKDSACGLTQEHATFAAPFYRPCSIANPLRGCNSDSAQYSNTPLLRVAGFEDEDDDEYENEAPCEGDALF
jgi:hypothetical protein